MGIKAIEAADKLGREVSVSMGQRENVMKAAVAAALKTFCNQSEEFAAAVADGGSFEECMKAVAKGVGNSISDLEAYKKAVKHYFPQADIEMELKITMPGKEDQPSGVKLLHLSLADLM